MQNTYHTVLTFVGEKKHFLSASSTSEDDCRCKKCENVELLLNCVKNSKVVIPNACHFAEHANEVCKVNVLNLDKNDIQYPNIDDCLCTWDFKSPTS